MIFIAVCVFAFSLVFAVVYIAENIRDFDAGNMFVLVIAIFAAIVSNYVALNGGNFLKTNVFYIEMEDEKGTRISVSSDKEIIVKTQRLCSAEVVRQYNYALDRTVARKIFNGSCASVYKDVNDWFTNWMNQYSNLIDRGDG